VYVQEYNEKLDEHMKQDCVEVAYDTHRMENKCMQGSGGTNLKKRHNMEDLEIEKIH
jgi:hypothetical protein